MKQRFTKLLAAVALLVFMMPTMAGWGQTTATISSFSEISGYIDQNISYAANKGNGTSEPIVSNGRLRIYKPSSGGTGGYVTITALNGCKMTSVTITNSNDKSGTIKYSVDEGSLSDAISLSTDAHYTVDGITASAISFYNTGSDRLSIAGFTIIYTEGGTPALYTVTLYDTGDELTETSTGSGVTLPSRDNVPPYTFAGWSTTNIPAEITSAPTIIPVGLYYPSSDITLYPIYTRTESSGSTTTEWHLTELSAADAGTYALLTTDYHAFNGNISSGHGQVTQDAFEFTNNVATSAPSSICEITFEAVTGGFKMKNDATSTYLYASKASSGGLAWHDSEDSYWKNDDNWVYNQNSARLRSYSNNSFRTYSTNNGNILKLAKKVTVSGGTTYYVSVVATITSLTCTGTPTTTSYYEGDSFDPTGLTVTAIFDDNSTSDVTSLVTWTPDPLTVGNTTVTGTYMSFSVTVEGITVNEIPDYAELPFVWNGGSSTDFAAIFGTTIHGNGTDYTAHAPYLIKLDSDGDYIQVKTNERPGKVIIGVKMIGGATTSTITVQGSADGEIFTDIEALTISGDQNDVLTLETTNAFAATDRYVRMLFTKGSNVGVGPITITKVYTKTINAYDPEANPANGWYLIASPLTESTAPTAINGLVASDGHYDLYRFNQNPTVTNGDYLEWENYKIHSDGFLLENGKGYLYASQASTTLYFNGECNTGATKTVNLDYSGTNPDENMRGWNLVGNPFATSATINLPFYKMNDGGTALTGKLESGTIDAMEGAFVYAYDETTQQAISSVEFTASRSRGKSNALVNINVMYNGAAIDNAIVRFDEGMQLPKFQLFKNSAKLFITKNGKDYAIVNSEAQGEMPVNFNAEENGTYTLNIDTENVEMNYLHLIDNMTGMDVDLLQTPSYTFDATTNDYASRFRLVFSANNVDGPSTGSETFAFYSNGNWVVGNEGEATLQVIDVNGRIVSNETINGTVSTSINATPGVYMLRLVNGNEVKTQKIVVR